MITDLYNLKGVRTMMSSWMGRGGREGNGLRRLRVRGKLATICKIPRKGEDAVEAFGVGTILIETTEKHKVCIDAPSKAGRNLIHYIQGKLVILGVGKLTPENCYSW